MQVTGGESQRWIAITERRKAGNVFSELKVDFGQVEVGINGKLRFDFGIAKRFPDDT